MEPEGSKVSSTRVFVAEFRSQLQRTVDWLNSSPLDRLDRPASGGSIADRAYRIAQSMVTETESLRIIEPRNLPRIRSHGAGSQLAVVGEELAASVESDNSDSVRLDLVLIDYVSRLLELRRAAN